MNTTPVQILAETYNATDRAVHVTESSSAAQFTETPVTPHTGLYTVNDEVFSPSTLTFQSLITVSSNPAVFTIHPVSDFDFTPGDGVAEFAGTQWINVGVGIGGTF